MTHTGVLCNNTRDAALGPQGPFAPRRPIPNKQNNCVPSALNPVQWRATWWQPALHPRRHVPPPAARLVSLQPTEGGETGAGGSHPASWMRPCASQGTFCSFHYLTSKKKKKEMRANGKSGAFSVYFFLFGVTWSSKRGPITRCSRDEQRRRTSAQLNPSSNLSEWREVNIKKKPDPLGGNVWRGTSTDIGRDSAHSECGRVTSDQQNNTKVDKSFYETSGPLRNNQVKALIHHQDS